MTCRRKAMAKSDGVRPSRLSEVRSGCLLQVFGASRKPARWGLPVYQLESASDLRLGAMPAATAAMPRAQRLTFQCPARSAYYRPDGVRITSGHRRCWDWLPRHDPYAPGMAEKYGVPGKTDNEGWGPSVRPFHRLFWAILRLEPGFLGVFGHFNSLPLPAAASWS